MLYPKHTVRVCFVMAHVQWPDGQRGCLAYFQGSKLLITDRLGIPASLESTTSLDPKSANSTNPLRIKGGCGLKTQHCELANQAAGSCNGAGSSRSEPKAQRATATPKAGSLQRVGKTRSGESPEGNTTGQSPRGHDHRPSVTDHGTRPA